MHASPNRFANWVKEKITENTVPNHWYYLNMYCELLEPAAIVAGYFDLARKANEILYMNGDDHFIIEAAVNLAFYANKLNKVADKDRLILTDCYNKI